jgi:hypothetical protein
MRAGNRWTHFFHHRPHLPPWIRSIDLFLHRRVAIVSWGVHDFSRNFADALKYVVSTYLLTPWSRVLPDKLTVNFASSQEIPRIYGTRKFLTVPTSARHLLRLRDTSSRNTPPRRFEWGSSLPPECFVSRGSISHG